ncbi:MAG: iron chaperone [Maritimibacter sp.]
MSKPDSFDSYLAACPAEARLALMELALRIEALLPKDATRSFSYGMPGWRVPVRAHTIAASKSTTAKTAPPKAKGTLKVVAGMGAFSKSLGFYPHSGTIIPHLAERLAAQGFKTSKSGITFTPTTPIPDWALKEALDRRITEIG